MFFTKLPINTTIAIVYPKLRLNFSVISTNPRYFGELDLIIGLNQKLFSKIAEQVKMPAISSRFNRFLGILLGQFALISLAYSQINALSESDLQWLGDRIYANECASRFACLSSWNEGEDFPSLGIGHFIWFPENKNAPFEQTFPDLIQFYLSNEVEVPLWIIDQKDSGAPWQSREEFYEDFDSQRMRELRIFLADTKSIQVNFIVKRLNRSLEEIIAAFPFSQQTLVRQKLTSIASSHLPYGSYALIDYVHFKGTGLATVERYSDKGWGLKQVIESMLDSPSTLYSFVQAAKQTLIQRVENAPPERNEQRWIAGWQRRVETYLPTP